MSHKNSRFLSSQHVKEEQEALIALGFKLDKFGADGKMGPETRAAMKAFLQSIDFDPADGMTPRQALLEAKQQADRERFLSVQTPAAAPGGLTPPNPLEIAQRHIGLSEKKSSKEISRFIHQEADIKINPQKTAWCAAFVNAVLSEAGLEGTGKLTARSFLNYGHKTKDPEPGDIVILKRGAEAWQGHVGFVVDRFKHGSQWMVKVLGGNQGPNGEVSVKTYSEKDLLGYRKPPVETQRYAGNTQNMEDRKLASRTPPLSHPTV